MPLRLLFLFSQFHGFVSVTESFSKRLKVFLKRIRKKSFMPGTLYCPVIGRQHFWTPHIYHFQLLKCHFWVYIFCLHVRVQSYPKSRSVSPTSLIFSKKWEWIYPKTFHAHTKSQFILFKFLTETFKKFNGYRKCRDRKKIWLWLFLDQKKNIW